MSNKSDSKRITFKRARPNPLFQDWLEELHDEAQTKKSKLEPMLDQALNSLKKYPLPLKSGAECIILQGFEKKLCMYLDQRLEVYYENMGLAAAFAGNSQSSSSNGDCSGTSGSQISHSTNKSVKATNTTPVHDHEKENTSETNSQNRTSPNTDTNSVSSNGTNGSKKKSKEYKPEHRSGGYAILVTLLEETDKSMKRSLTKEEIIEKAQKHSEESFTRPKPQSFYTAWSNMTRLVTKGFVMKTRKKKVEYMLSDTGVALARQLLNDNKTIPTVNDIIFNKEVRVVLEKNIDLLRNFQSHNVTNNDNNEAIELPAGSFDIILLIDKNETGGLTKKNDPTVSQFNKYPDLKHEYRSLKVGDFTWVARHKNSGQELVLPYVIERKRMDDLGASIKDGRFHEQKFRLRKCGLSYVIYMVENYGSNKNVGLPIQTLMQALANTRVQDGFKVQMTDSLTNSARFLAMMTKRLTIRFKDKNLQGRNNEPREGDLMTFEYFNKASSKTKALTVTETFIKLLLQLKGLTVEKALAITNKYSTPNSLIKAYEKCDQKGGQFLLANLKYGDMCRNVGPVISKSIYQLFSCIGVD